jgi:uncharacterized membrane protein
MLNRIGAQGAILAAVLGTTILWLLYVRGLVVSPKAGVDMGQQLALMLADPLRFLAVLTNTLWSNRTLWLHEMIGILGWLNVELPFAMNVLALLALAGCMLLPRPQRVRLSAAEIVWNLLLVAGSALLLIVTLYLYWEPVGARSVSGVQGRYFLPLAGAVAAAIEGLWPLLGRSWGARAQAAILACAALGALLTPAVIVSAYNVF